MGSSNFWCWRCIWSYDCSSCCSCWGNNSDDVGCFSFVFHQCFCTDSIRIFWLELIPAVFFTPLFEVFFLFLLELVCIIWMCLNICCLLVFVVYWWILCCFTIGWSYSTATICYQQRNWMAGSWGVAEWFLWYFYWCNCCPVSNWTYKPCLKKLSLFFEIFPALFGQTKLY